jgi:hypothetical protein
MSITLYQYQLKVDQGPKYQTWNSELPNSFYEANITLIPKVKKNTATTIIMTATKSDQFPYWI